MIRESEFAQVVRWLVEALPADGVMLDVGANVGAISAHVKAARPGATIHLFEPIPRHVQLARDRLAALSGIVINAFGLSDCAGHSEIYTEPGNPGWSTLDAAFAAPGKIVTSVELCRLDDYPLERLDVVKLDVEYWEGRVLKGGRRTIDRFLPVIVSELSRASEDLWYERVGEMERLFDLGYRRIDYRVKGRCNVVFSPPAKAVRP